MPQRVTPRIQPHRRLLGNWVAGKREAVACSSTPRPSGLHGPEAILRLQRTVGNQATQCLLQSVRHSAQDQGRTRPQRATPAAREVVQRTAINPAAFFGAHRGDDDVNAGIAGNQLTGFGATVDGVTWHTKLSFSPLVQTGPVGGEQLNPEGSGVQGVIGPEHPYGSQPHSVTAAQNNQRAGTMRGWNPHGHVAAHIVNDQLGGPGIAQNLFALPGNANTLMETQVESKMKEAVEDGNFIYYSAQVNHPANGPADSITMSWNKLDETGADIGGGQTNVQITAVNTAHNTDVNMQAGGVAARKGGLRHPTNPTVISGAPWGPFQMPDPKNILAVGPFLDYSEFPAVGSKKAFERFLKNNRNNKLSMGLLWAAITDTALFTNIGRWIESKSGITVRRRAGRGITKPLLQKLLHGPIPQRQSALEEILKTGDGVKVIPFAAKQLAKAARPDALTRI